VTVSHPHSINQRLTAHRLDDPTVPPEALRGLDALAGDPHLDAAAANLSP
jgi:hypothetical protein